MAAPTPTARVAPADALFLENGFKTHFTLTSDPNMAIYDSEIGIPDLDGGPPIKVTTMFSTKYHTYASAALIDMKPFTVVGFIKPNTRQEFLAQVNKETTGTITWPGGATDAFYCYPQMISITPLKEGEAPVATLTIVPTNRDPATGVEEPPVHTPAPPPPP